MLPRRRADILLEGPPGTSKSTMLRRSPPLGRAVRAGRGQRRAHPGPAGRPPQPGRCSGGLLGDNFVPGRWSRRCRRRFLYIEELNRPPRTPSTCCSRRWPSGGRCRGSADPALPTFRVLASMNPFDNVGTARISDSVYDRWCRLAVGYQDAAEERDIVVVRTGCPDDELVADAVAITRATRAHPELRRGSSVRGAIDLVAIADASWPRSAATTERRRPRGWCSTPRCSRCPAGSAWTRPATLTPEAGDHRDLGEPFFLAPRRAAPGPHRLSVDNAVQLPGAGVTAARAGAAAPQAQAARRDPALFQPGAGAAAGARTTAPRRTGDPAPASRPAGRACWSPGSGRSCATSPSCSRTARRTAEVAGWPSGSPAGWRSGAARRDRAPSAARARLASVPYRYRSDDIDLDRTIEVLTERPVPEDTDIVVRERMRSRRAVVLIVDVSGSMRGEKVRIAAATVAALSAELAAGAATSWRWSRSGPTPRCSSRWAAARSGTAAAGPAAAHPGPRADQRRSSGCRWRSPS